MSDIKDKCLVNTEHDCPFDPIKMGAFFQSVIDIRNDIKEIKDIQKENADNIVLLLPVKTEVAKLSKHVEKQNGRISKLENWRWYLSGIAVTALFGLKYFGVF